MLSIIFAATISVVATWTASTSDDVAKYRLYMSNVSGSYGATPILETGKDARTATLSVPEERTKFFVLTAVDEAENESAYSNEVSVSDKKKPVAPGSLTITVAP